MPQEIKWTPDLVKQLTELWGDGVSTTRIGKLLGFTKNAIVGKAYKLKLPPRPSPIRILPLRPRKRRKFDLPAKASVHVSGCRWPVDNSSNINFGLCGDEVVGSSMYCQKHDPAAAAPARRGWRAGARGLVVRDRRSSGA